MKMPKDGLESLGWAFSAGSHSTYSHYSVKPLIIDSHFADEKTETNISHMLWFEHVP